MSKWIDRFLGINNYDEFADDDDYESYWDKQKKRDDELKEKIFNGEEDLTYDEFTRLLDITAKKFKSSFGCFGSDYEIVFRKKNKPQPKKKKESGKSKDEK